MASCESVINSKSSPSETKEEEEIRIEEPSFVFSPVTEKGVAPFLLHVHRRHAGGPGPGAVQGEGAGMGEAVQHPPAGCQPGRRD